MSKGDIRAGGGFVELFTKDGLFYKGLSRSLKALQGWGGRAAAVAAGAGVATFGISNGLAAAQAVASKFSLVGITQQFANAGSHVDAMAKRVGLTASEFSSMAPAVSSVGAEMDTFADSMKDMGEFMWDVAEGTEDALGLLGAMGVDQSKLLNASQLDRYYMLADALKGIRDPALRSAAANKIFGESGFQLMPMMLKGSEAMKAMAAEARELGEVMTDEDAAAATKLKTAFGSLLGSVTSVGNKLGATLAGPILAVSKGLQRVLPPIGKWIDNNRALIASIASVAAGAFGIATSLAAVAVGGAFIGPLIGPVLGLAAGLGVVATVAVAVYKNFGSIASYAGAAFGYIADLVPDVVSNWVSNWFSGIQSALGSTGEFAAGAMDYFSTIAEAIAAGDFESAWKTATAGMNVIWQTTVGGITSFWYETVEGLKAMWAFGVGFISDTANNAFLGMRTVWAGTVGFMERTWARFAGFIQKSANNIVYSLQILSKHLKGDWGREGEIDAIRKHWAESNKAIDAKVAGQVETANNRQSLAVDRAASYHAANAKAIADRTNSAISEAVNTSAQKRQRAAESVQAAKSTYTAEIAAAKQSIELRKLEAPAKLDAIEIDGFKVPTTAESTSTSGAAAQKSGTFSAFAAAMGGVSTYEQQMVTHLSTIKDVLKRIDAKQGGLT